MPATALHGNIGALRGGRERQVLRGDLADEFAMASDRMLHAAASAKKRPRARDVSDNIRSRVRAQCRGQTLSDAMPHTSFLC
jgi:hypothetical protein